MSEKRFQKVLNQTVAFGEGAEIIVDTQTGVNYLFYRSGYGGGLTPLLNRDGTPVITPTGAYQIEA